jgi:hypothetical protein
MQTPSADTSLHRHARRRVALKLGWFMHAAVYLSVNLLLIVLAQGSTHPRVHPGPLLGWGLGLGIHGLVVAFSLLGGGLRQRMFERELQRLQQQPRG